MNISYSRGSGHGTVDSVVASKPEDMGSIPVNLSPVLLVPWLWSSNYLPKRGILSLTFVNYDNSDVIHLSLHIDRGLRM